MGGTVTTQTFLTGPNNVIVVAIALLHSTSARGCSLSTSKLWGAHEKPMVAPKELFQLSSSLGHHLKLLLSILQII